MTNRIFPHELKATGGKWLAAARSFLQNNVPFGDSLTWSSSERVRITVKQIEDLAADVATAALNDPPRKLQKLPTLPIVISKDIGGLCITRRGYQLLRNKIPEHPEIKLYEESMVNEFWDQEWKLSASIGRTWEDFLNEFVTIPMVERTHHALLSLTEHLSDHKVVYVPPDIEWYIHDDGTGVESVHEKHRVWS